MKLIVFVSLALCMAFVFAQAEANPQFLDLLNKFGGSDAVFQGVNTIMNVSTKMMEAFESMIRQGKSVAQAIPELMRLLPSMIS